MNWFSSCRFWSSAGDPCAALLLPSAEITVAPIIFTPGSPERIRPTTSFIPASTASTSASAFRLKSLMPSNQMTAETPDRLSTSLSRRCRAEGPPANGFCGEYSAGPIT